MSCGEEVLLWKGCTYRNQLPDELDNIENILKKLEIPFNSIEEECIKLKKEISILNEEILHLRKLITKDKKG